VYLLYGRRNSVLGRTELNATAVPAPVQKIN
jgi:hypothetical protein